MYLFGIAALATLPPFEALDEAEYWSAVQQFSDTGQLPRYGEARVSSDVAAYPGPQPASTGQPYTAFFAAPEGGAGVFTTGPSHYAPGDGINYEAQHPPLFFFLMRPLYRMAASLSWPAHFLLLRLANWTIAFIGFALGALVTQRVLRERDYSGPVLLVPVVWPFLFPQFFCEFTRITNDTVCLAIISLVWWGLVRHLQHGSNWRRSVVLGLLLGAGLLTKAFFLPVTAGVSLLLIVEAWRTRRPGQWAAALVVPLLAVLTGGFWYVHAMILTGNVTGAADFIQVQQQGGVLSSAHKHFPTLLDMLVLAPGLYLAGLLRMVVGFCWAGTWSFMHPSRLLVLPVAVLVLVPCGLYARRVRRADLLALAPVFMVAPVLAGLLYHLATMLAVTGEGSGTPGWFFHIFAGPLSLVLALGWGRRALMLPLVGYAAGFGAVMFWAQMAFFSGCLPRAGRGEVNLLDAVCLVNAGHLRLLAFPELAFFSEILGAALLLAAALAGFSSRADPPGTIAL